MKSEQKMFKIIKKYICALRASQRRPRTTIYKHWREDALDQSQLGLRVLFSIYGKRGGAITLLLHCHCGNSDRWPIRRRGQESGRFVYVGVFKGSSFSFPTLCWISSGREKKGGCEFLNLRGKYWPDVYFRFTSVETWCTKSWHCIQLLNLKQNRQTHKV